MLLAKGAIEKNNYDINQFCSPIFLVKKPNGTFRFILNLKKLNMFINTSHFKLEDYRTACKLIDLNDYLVSIDLKDAYYMIQIHNDSKQFLKFYYEGEYYQFKVLPFGLCTAPFTFTKIMKPVVAYLRENGFVSVIYLDDILCIGTSVNDCLVNMTTTVNLLTRLGFVINTDKSELAPAQTCKFLGFIFDSKQMKLSISVEKRLNCLKLIKQLLLKKTVQLKFLAQVIGTLVSVCPAIKYGMLYTKDLERVKYLALKYNNDNYDAYISLNDDCKQDLMWWAKSIETGVSPIRKNRYKLEIYTDSSSRGWGVSCGSKTASGLWTTEEAKLHINTLELKAAFFGLKCFAKDLKKCDILLHIDNVTAISHINRLGGVQFSHLHSIAKKIWQWCEVRDLWIFATYINTKENVIADFQ